MEDDLPKKMDDDLKKKLKKNEDDLKKKLRTTQILFSRTRMTTSEKMEDDLKKKKGRRPKKNWKTNQSTKFNLIGCDTIVNSPSYSKLLKYLNFGLLVDNTNISCDVLNTSGRNIYVYFSHTKLFLNILISQERKKDKKVKIIKSNEKTG
jgi:hypothetical protein